MKRSSLLFLFVVTTFALSAQNESGKPHRPTYVWVYTKENRIQKGFLTGFSDKDLILYAGNENELKKEKSPQLISFNYENIDVVRAKKRGGLLSGFLIGAAIGLTPIVFGQGGAFVAVVTVPLGAIIGTIVGVTAKKKYMIHGDLTAFEKFKHKVIK